MNKYQKSLNTIIFKLAEYDTPLVECYKPLKELVERNTAQTPKYKRTSIDTVIINCTVCNYHLNTSLINERDYMKFCPRCGQRIAGDDNE